jgi:HYR domain-containing protein
VKYEATCRRVRFMSFVAVLTCGSMAAQGVRSIEDGETLAPVAALELVRTELAGFVHEPAGAPAEGVVVVSSAGGKALTDADGAYRLEVCVPVGAGSVQVTAVGAHGLVASTSAPAPSASRSVQVPPLVLGLGNSCSPSWLPTFGGMGTSDAVYAVAEYDAGAGPELYAAGRFLAAGGVPADRIAKWDGTSWKALGSGLSGGEARALAVYDDGSGPALFVGGEFTTAGGAPASRIAKWDGTTWSSVGGGVNNTVRAFAVWDDGGGPALYVAGSFGQAGGASASRIARWNGTSWTTLGSGINGTVHALLVHDDGSGPALYAGGIFSRAGGNTEVNSIARWNGTSWAKLGNGVGSVIYALAAYDAGAGPALYAGGSFAVGTFFRLARWNGSSWSGLGSPITGTIQALRTFDDGTGSKLWVGGNFHDFGGSPGNSLVLYDGSTWQAVGSGMHSEDLSPDVTDVLAFCTHDDGDGTALIVGGRFSDADGHDVNNVAKRVGSSFTGFGTGLDGSVRAAAMYDDGTGPALYAGGDFVTAEGVTLNHVGKWDGSQWTPLDGGVDGNVHVLLVHDDGSGPALFAGGDFVTAGGATVSRIAKWNGTSWAELDRGVSLGGVRALAVHNGQLYAGGTFLVAGGAFGSTPVNRIARWDGSRWHSLGTGVNTQDGIVKALISYNDGNGARLYAAGEFSSIGDTPITTIAKWTGSFWTPLAASFPNHSIEALAVHDGSLYAGGGGFSTGRIARWNGTSWSALADGDSQSAFGDRVLSIAVHDDGSGAMLYVGGNAGMLRWNGSSWGSLGGGALGSVLALTTCDVGSGASLFAGGQVFGFVDSADSFLGEWGCDRIPPVLSAPPVRVIDEPGNGPGEVVVAFPLEVSDDHDPAPELWFDWPPGSLFPQGTTMVTCLATDAAGNQSSTEFPVTVQEKVRFKKL